MSLRDSFDRHNGRLIGKIDHFFDNYESHFSPYRDTAVRVLELGINEGGSLELWRAYFGPAAQIHGVDINPQAARCAPADCAVHIGSQVDSNFLQRLLEKHGPFDIVIDDGSHLMQDQIQSFELIYPCMAESGVYVCEDAFTSYWPEYGGELGKTSTFIEYAKQLVDELHAYWIHDDHLKVSPFTRSTGAIHFYSGTVVFQRQSVTEPRYVVKHGEVRQDISIRDLQLAARRNLES